MQDSIVAIRYAEALSGLEVNDLNQLEQELTMVVDTLSKESANLDFFISPMVSAEDKKKVMIRCFKEKVMGTVLNFILILIDKNRESKLMAIYEQFLLKNDKKLGRLKPDVAFSKNLPDELNQEIQEELSGFIQKYKKKFGVENSDKKLDFQFNTKVNESILGGFIIRIGDQYLDMSVVRYLKDWKKLTLSKKVNLNKYWIDE